MQQWLIGKNYFHCSIAYSSIKYRDTSLRAFLLEKIQNIPLLSYLRCWSHGPFCLQGQLVHSCTPNKYCMTELLLWMFSLYSHFFFYYLLLLFLPCFESIVSVIGKRMSKMQPLANLNPAYVKFFSFMSNCSPV
jgi:hypothetical protein